MKFLKNVVTLSLALALSASCTKAKKDPNLKELILALGDDVKHGDPAQANDTISIELNNHIFEGLLTYDYDGKVGDIKPLLATALPITENKEKVFTFKLRDDVYFQDDAAFSDGKGRKLKASDFVYSFKRIADPRSGSTNWWTLDGMVEGLNEWRLKMEKAGKEERNQIFAENVKGLEAVDDLTLKIKLTKSYPQFLYIIAMPHMVAMAPEVVEKYGEDITSHPVGTGPYKLVEWIRGSKIIVDKNPNFRKLEYQGALLPRISKINWEIIKEEQPRLLKFLNGQLDATGIPKDSFSKIIGADGELTEDIKKKGVTLYKSVSLTTWWLEFNLKDPILGKNLKLRQALATAFDRAKGLELLFNNRGVLSDAPIPTGLEGASDLSPYPYAFNLEKAKALLAEAGYPEGKGLPALTFDLRGPSTTARQLGEFIKDNFSKIGVSLNVISNTFPEALDKAKQAKFQIMLSGWGADYPDAENFLQLFYGPNGAPATNTTNFKNAKFDKLYEEIRTVRPSPARNAKIKEMAKILQDEAIGAFWYHSVDFYLISNRVLNYKPQELSNGDKIYWDLKTGTGQ